MHVELTSAADFLCSLVKLNTSNIPLAKRPQLNDSDLELFKGNLLSLLRSRYRGHWFPEHPNRGSGYRCIRINNKMDPIISQAGAAAGLPPKSLRNLFPIELTLWIDPWEVSYRFGENGSICVLYEKRPPLIPMFEDTPRACPSVAPPLRLSPELYLDPRQFEQIDPFVDYVC